LAVELLLFIGALRWLLLLPLSFFNWIYWRAATCEEIRSWFSHRFL